jgi:hypothetical protein
MKLSSCGLEVVDLRKNCDCRIAELRLRSNISLKSCGIAIAEVLLQVAELQLRILKKVARPHLWITVIFKRKILFLQNAHPLPSGSTREEA